MNMSDNSELAPEDLVAVQVSTRYLPDHLPDSADKYAFAYQITIRNHNTFPVTLESRYWLITDANNKRSEVQGDGVVGKQPTIAPGESFQYTSGAVIDTPVGSMQGYYVMTTQDGRSFKTPIAPFSLALPNAIN